MGMEQRDASYDNQQYKVSISYMGMEQQHLVDIKIITSRYGNVKLNYSKNRSIILVNHFTSEQFSVSYYHF